MNCLMKKPSAPTIFTPKYKKDIKMKHNAGPAALCHNINKALHSPDLCSSQCCVGGRSEPKYIPLLEFLNHLFVRRRQLIIASVLVSFNFFNILIFSYHSRLWKINDIPICCASPNHDIPILCPYRQRGMNNTFFR